MAVEEYKEDEMPLVSVAMLVYNHEKWVAQAIESIMKQETNFQYVLVIGEDCSTDGSREIVKSYQRMYPDRIIAILNEHNLGMEANSNNIGTYLNGKYLACCEGDDYWTDSKKLQRQVEFMEAHPEYSAIFHSTEIVDSEGNPMYVEGTGFIYEDDSDLSWESAARMTMGGQVASVLARNPKYYADPYLAMENRNLKVLHGDHKGNLLYLSYGRIRRCHVPVSAYRRTYEGSSFNSMSVGQDLHYYNYVGLLETARYLNMFAPVHVDNRPSAFSYLMHFFINFFDGKKGKIKNIKIMFKYQPILFLKFFVRIMLLCLLSKEFRNSWLISAIKRHEEILAKSVNTSYIVFGTGIVGKQCIEFFSRMGWEEKIKNIWDNDVNKQGNVVKGIPVLRPGLNCDRLDVVIVASRKYKNEMKSQAMSFANVNPAQVKVFDEWISDVIGQILPHSIMLRLLKSLLKYNPQEFRFI